MKRYEKNPIITRNDIPDGGPPLRDVTSVFNPGAVKFNDDYVLLLRVQNRGRETFTLKATSSDGKRFSVSKTPVLFDGIEKIEEPVYHCYDPRITRIGETFYIMFAMDRDEGCALGLARTGDFESYAFMGIVSTEDTRNGVLFPEKINGRYVRLERPNGRSFSSGTTSGDTICIAESDDLLNWQDPRPVASGRRHYWDEYIGAGPPPVKTREGWLLIYHGVALHLSSIHIYQAGVMLLDLDDPSRVIARGRYNALEPRETYELIGQVPNVVFPSGAIVEEEDEHGFAKMDSRVKIYYGAADTSVCLASSTIDALIDDAKEGA